ncbi:MAG: NUDIX hydrolase [Telmatospirillum sp.]|nr:NUDIX hydrolase [Telmatospirillum sp.]
MKLYLQYAALPFHIENGQLRILLITSRETRRWVLPKGWPEKKLKPHQVAAKEAFEEAGLSGAVCRTPVAAFEYEKLLDARHKVTCLVEVFPMRVSEVLEQWPEKHQRQRRWMPPEEAAALVQEKGLRRFLRDLALHPDQADFAD